MESVVYRLQKKNAILKSHLIHDMIRHRNYGFYGFKREMNQIVTDYYHTKSIFKSANNMGIDPKIAFKWYIMGQCRNSYFRPFYLQINHINNLEVKEENEISECVGEYEISQYGDGWSYKTYVGGEKIFIIANELEDLKDKVKSRHLPLGE